MISYFARFFILVVLFALISITSSGQQTNDYGFSYWNNLKARNDVALLENPWSGGMNNVQFGEIDLNNDGFLDLLSFDRHGNRLLPFILENPQSSNNWYRFDPQYRQYFPSINSIFQMHDYNNDSKPDIFTYTTGGLMVYKNVSQQQIRFEKAVKQFIKSLQGNIFTNLLVTNVDYPAIYDLDNDNDFDILTFWGLGSFIELHQNMSMETYGSSDSLLFHKVDYCWGNFAENAESNDITLDTCVNLNDFSNRNSTEIYHERHTGSTLAVIDLNQDNMLDLALGDVDYMNIQSLINGGSNLDALMVSHNDSFPSDNPVKLASFPAVQQINIYDDDTKDLIISPFDPGLTKSAGYNSVWHYRVSSLTGELLKESENFLQGGMIDIGLGCYPVFAELTGDSLIDLVISNYGGLDSCYYNNNGQLNCTYHSSVHLYKNSGTKLNPEFSLLTNDLASLGTLNLISIHTAFGNFNDDQLPDMVVGTADNKLYIYYNSGYLNNLPQFAAPQEISAGLSETFLTPAVADIDKDGLADILVGNKSGKLSLLINDGTLQNASFSLVTNNFGQINTTETSQSYTGYSVPSFVSDNHNNLRLIVGSESGKLHYYPQIPTSDFENQLIEKTDVFSKINEGIRTSVSMMDINADGFIDLALGNYAGGVTMYKGETPGPMSLDETPSDIKALEVYPNPAYDKVNVILPIDENRINEPWLLQVFDLKGELKLERLISEKPVTLEINRLKSGLYLIVASQPECILMNKLVIIR